MRPRLRLGAYEPLLELASGGMATVYVARQLGAAGFQRLVVIKRVHRHLLGNREFRDMFIDEARVASLIRHPNVVSVSDVVESEGELFLVMDYVESTSLSTLLSTANKRGERLSPAVAARIVADVLAGMHAAHEATDMQGRSLELVHRDVSPQNILVGIDGVARLIDFGIAKAAHRITETRSGSLKGKLGYMSPEGARGLPIDRRADLFAAGVVLHEALTSKRLFFGANEFDTLRRVLELDPPPPSAMASDVSPILDAVTLRALARDPDQRFPTAAAFLEALERAIPFATAREVSAAIERACAPRLEERRAELRALLDGTAEPRFELSSRPNEALTNAGLTRPGAEPRSEGTESAIAATRDSPAPKPKLRHAPLLGAMLGGVVVTLAVGGVLLSRGGGPEKSAGAGPSAEVAPPALPPPPSAPAASSTSAPSAGEVQILLTGDRPIESVRARGLRRFELDGPRARIFVAPWQGRLSIEATLEGGRVVVREAEAPAGGGGSIEVSLAVKPPASAAPVARPRGGDELHGNPYGP